MENPQQKLHNFSIVKKNSFEVRPTCSLLKNKIK